MRALAAAIVITFALAPAAMAQPASQDKKLAKKLIAQGDALYARGEYKAALDKYRAAYEAYDSPKIFYTMAATEEKLGQDLEALYHYQQLLADAGAELSEDLRKEVELKIGALHSRNAIVVFMVEPQGAQILIDSTESELAEAGEPVVLLPGVHDVVITKQGFKTVEKTLDLKPGDRPVERIELAPAQPRVAGKGGKGGKGGERPTEPGRPSSGRGVLVAGVVGTSLLAGGTVVLGLMALSKHGVYVDGTKPMQERLDARDQGKSFALVADILLAGAVVTGGFTTYWYFAVWKPRAAAREREPGAPAGASLQAVSPWVSDDGAGVLFSGRF